MKISDDGKAVSVEIKVWLECDGSIRLALPGFPPPYVTIKNDPERPSGHPRLFRYLAQHLTSSGALSPRILVET